MRVRSLFSATLFLLGVALTTFSGGCSKPEKAADPDALKKESEDLKKNLQKEWGNK